MRCAPDVRCAGSGTGGFDGAQCVTLEALEAMTEDAAPGLSDAGGFIAGDHTVVTLDAENAARFLSGMRRRGDWPDAAQVAVYASADGSLLGTAHVKAGELIPGRLLSPLEIDR